MIKLGKAAQEYADSVIDNIKKGEYSFEWYEDIFWDNDDDEYPSDPDVLDYIREKLFGGAS